MINNNKLKDKSDEKDLHLLKKKEIEDLKNLEEIEKKESNKHEKLITKKMANMSIIIGSILFIIILGIIYKYFGVETLSNTLFLIPIYLLLVITIFFTFISYIHKYTILKNINYIINKIIKKIGVYPSKKIKLNPIKKQILNEIHKHEKKKNNKIIIKTLVYFGIFIVIMFICSMITWKYTKLSYKDYTKIIIKNLIIVIIVIIIEIIFYFFVIGNSRPVGMYNIIKNMIINNTTH